MAPLRALSLLAVYLPTALAECKTYCAYRTHPIEEKCGWAGCDTCVPCLPCMPHCPVATHPWEEKCELAGCGGCTECSVPPPSPPAQCKTYCAYRTHPIEEKCEWSGCNGCGECEPSPPPPVPPALPPQPPPCEPTSMTLVTIDFSANWAAASQLGPLAGTVWTGMKWLLKTSEGVAHEFEHPVKTVSNFPCGAPSFLGLPLPEPDCECGLQNTFHPPVELECGVEYTIETTPVSDMTNMFATSENSLCPQWYFVPTANLEQLREGMVMMCENSDFQLEGAAGGPKTTAYLAGRQQTWATVDDIGAACGSNYTKTIAVENGAPCAHAHLLVASLPLSHPDPA